MPIKVAVLKEVRPEERRVAMVPAVVDRLLKLGTELYMQTGAGDASKLPDAAFRNVTFVSDPQRLVSDADVVLAVHGHGQALKELGAESGLAVAA